MLHFSVCRKRTPGNHGTRRGSPRGTATSRRKQNKTVSRSRGFRLIQQAGPHTKKKAASSYCRQTASAENRRKSSPRKRLRRQSSPHKQKTEGCRFLQKPAPHTGRKRQPSRAAGSTLPPQTRSASKRAASPYARLIQRTRKQKKNKCVATDEALRNWLLGQTPRLTLFQSRALNGNKEKQRGRDRFSHGGNGHFSAHARRVARERRGDYPARGRRAQ